MISSGWQTVQLLKLIKSSNKCSAVAEIGDRLAVPLLGGELGPHLTQCGLGRGLPPC